MTTNQYYYSSGKEITKKEAHDLKDKSGLIVADKAIKFKKEKKEDGGK